MGWEGHDGQGDVGEQASPVRTEQTAPGRFARCQHTEEGSTCDRLLPCPVHPPLAIQPKPPQPPMCLRCQWAEPLRTSDGEIVPGKQVECHRYPPTPVVLPVQTLAGAGLSIEFRWTVVLLDTYCGEFQEAAQE